MWFLKRDPMNNPPVLHCATVWWLRYMQNNADEMKNFDLSVFYLIPQLPPPSFWREMRQKVVEKKIE
jgi:hypothetical protein